MHAPPYAPHLAPAPAAAPNASIEWVYDKTDAPVSYAEYTHLVTEAPAPPASGSNLGFGFMKKKKDMGWTEVGSVLAFDRWAVDLGLLKLGEGHGMGVLQRVQGALPRLEERERLWVLERTGK